MTSQFFFPLSDISSHDSIACADLTSTEVIVVDVMIAEVSIQSATYSMEEGCC